MRIALITNLYPPIQTGTANWARGVADYMVGAGHEVTVITCAPQHQSAESDSKHIGVFRLPAYRMPTSRFLLGFDQFYVGNSPSNTRRVREILAARKIEVAHQVGHLLDLTYLTPQVCRQLRIPAVCSLHTVIYFPDNKFVNWLMQTIDRLIVRQFAVRHYQALCATDAEIQRYAHARYQRANVPIIPEYVDPSLVEQSPACLEDTDGVFRILSVGHITAMRPRLDLIQAVEQLERQGVPIELTIVGKILTAAPVELTRRLGLEHIVRFTGELPHSEIVQLWRSTHLEAHWITRPGLGMGLLEAMSLGVPAMTYGYPGIYGDVPLANRENILFIELGNVDQIAEQIALLARSPGLRKAIGQKGRRLVANYLTRSQVMGKLESIYAVAIRDYANQENYAFAT